MSDQTEKAVHLLISGRVQGVGYRAWVKRTAETMGLKGWVRNLRSGEVEAVICGKEADVDLFVEQCWQGPDWARVKSVDVISNADVVCVPGVQVLQDG